MPDHDEQLVEAAMQYLTLLEKGSAPNLDQYVTNARPELREELKPYLEDVLATGIPLETPASPADDAALVERANTRFQARLSQYTQLTPPRSLAEARRARKLSLATLAQQLNLPANLLERIERRGVLVATLPAKLIARLSAVLGYPEGTIRTMLGALPSASAIHEPPTGYNPSISQPTVRNSEDQDSMPVETAVSFAEALGTSNATPEQREEWE